MRTLEPGEIVERHVVERVLGNGGQATVYQVRHSGLGALRALKVLDAADTATRARLEAEGRLLAQLRHPNVVAVIDLLTIGDSPALLLEFVGGGSLHDRVAGHPLPDTEIEPFFLAILAGVEAVHAAGVVHRDLKPANVLLDDTTSPPTPKVADFGIARDTEADANLTRTRTGLGTPHYMAPEQARSARGVDARADIWSLGALLYAMLTGHPPFSGEVAWEVLAAASAGRYPSLDEVRPDVPAAWRAAVDACLRPNREERPADVAALRAIFLGTGGRARAGETWRFGTGDSALSLPLPLGEGGPEGRVRAQDDLALSTPSSGLRPPSPASGRRGRGGTPLPGQTTALVTDAAGVGHLVQVIVEVHPGEGTVVSPPGIARDAQVAAQVAVSAALGSARRRVVWQVRGSNFELHGTSIGLAIAVAVVSAVRRRPVPPDLAFTGGVDLDGRIAPVASVPAKLRAAADAGIRTVYVPAGSPATPGLVPLRADVDRLETVLATLFPGSRSRTALLAAAILLPALAAFTGLTDLVDARVHYPLLRAAGRDVAIEDVVVVTLPKVADLRALRPTWPAMLDWLAAAGPAVIVLDVAFSAETPEDAAIAAAIGRAGVPVVVPARVGDEVVIRPGSVAIAEAAVLGQAVSLADLDIGWIRRARLQVTDTSGTYWHVAALAASALTGGGSPEIADGTLKTGALRNAVDRNSFALAPFGEVPTLPIDGDLGPVRGRVAIVGSLHDGVDLQRTPEGPRYGAEVLAVEVQTLIRQAAPRSLPRELGTLLVLLTGVATAKLSRHAWVPAVTVSIAAVLLAIGGVLAPVAAPIAASLGVILLRRAAFL